MVPQKLIETNKAKHLFNDWKETIIWSCLQGVMGEIYVDQIDNPLSAMAILGDFCFLAGKPDRDLTLFNPHCQQQDFIIMIPQNSEWERMIEECYGNKARKNERYATKKEPNIFNEENLLRIINTLPKDYDLNMIDEKFFHQCLSNGWSYDLVSQYGDYETYSRLGIGVVIAKNGELVSGASSYSTYEHGIEIEIDTKEEYRRKGLASVCGAKLILECLKRNLYPSWDAQNMASISLAKKLGYNFSHAYTVYEIFGY